MYINSIHTIKTKSCFSNRIQFIERGSAFSPRLLGVAEAVEWNNHVCGEQQEKSLDKMFLFPETAFLTFGWHFDHFYINVQEGKTP